MDAKIFSVLDVARLRFYLRARGAVRLSPFLGSTLRGAFGHALKAVACPLEQPSCPENCLQPSACLYAYIFETKHCTAKTQEDLPRPFIFVPPARRNLHKPTAFAVGDVLSFGFTLMGHGLNYMPEVVVAISEMARRGFGDRNVEFVPCEIRAFDEAGLDRIVFDGQSWQADPDEVKYSLSQLISARLERLTVTETVKICFVTPARIRVGKDLKAESSFKLLVSKLLNRLDLLARAHGRGALAVDAAEMIEKAARVQLSYEQLPWNDIQRESQRHGERLYYGGFTGTINYRGENLAEFLPLLAAGEIVNVGKDASFGLGRYKIVS